MSPDEEAERARINAETAKIAWSELQRFFAAGHAFSVSRKLDLVDVAWHLSQDNVARLQTWAELGQVAPVSDAEAAEWFEANALMWCVVVRPWVLVQPVAAGHTH